MRACDPIMNFPRLVFHAVADEKVCDHATPALLSVTMALEQRSNIGGEWVGGVVFESIAGGWDGTKMNQ